MQAASEAATVNVANGQPAPEPVVFDCAVRVESGRGLSIARLRKALGKAEDVGAMTVLRVGDAMLFEFELRPEPARAGDIVRVVGRAVSLVRAACREDAGRAPVVEFCEAAVV